MNWSIHEANKMFPGTESETVQKLAKEYNYLRIYKIANDFGDKVTHTNYHVCKDANEEMSFFRSPYVHNVILVYDRGNIVNQQVTFHDTPSGREILGIEFLSDIMDDNKELKDRLSKIYYTFDKEETEKIVREGSKITRSLVDIALEFDPDKMEVEDMDEKQKIAGIALYMIGKIGQLDFEDVQRVFARFIQNRSGNDIVNNGWAGVFGDAVETLEKLGYKVVE